MVKDMEKIHEKGLKVQEKERDRRIVEHQDFVKDIQLATKETLIPMVREKAEAVSVELEKVLRHNPNGLTSTQIFNLITNRSTAPIDIIMRKSYTPEELAFAFQIYKEMIAKINEKVPFPPNKTTFCQLLGISTVTYNNYKQDAEKMEIMQIIDDYIVGNILTSAQVGQLEKITSIFSAKAQHGLVEATNPVIIEHKKETNIDEIQKRMSSIKASVIEAEYEEKD